MFPSLLLRPRSILLILGVYVFFALRSWPLDSSRLGFTESSSHHNSTVIGDRTAQAKHAMRHDGLLEVNMMGRHPFWELIEDAERRWKEMNARQSKTLREAVDEYIKRNGYLPPAGFDLWWEYTQKHNVKLVDEFDQINYDITPFLALSPRTFRTRVDAISDPNEAYHINITDGHVNMYGPGWRGGLERQLISMIAGFSRAIPNLDMHGHRHHRGDVWIGADLRKEALARARAGQYFTDDELKQYESVDRNPHRDLKNVCLPDDPIFNATRPSGAPTFVVSHHSYMSLCSSPSMHRTPPLLFTPDARPLGLIPRFIFSKHQPDSGFLLPTNTWGFHDPLLMPPHAWSERCDKDAHKLFWRGEVTGWNWFKDIASRESGITWRDGARAKLALTFSTNVGHGQKVQVLTENESAEGGLINRTYERAWLNERWMDVGLSGEPVQCHEEEGTCDEMRNAPMWGKPYPRHKEGRRKFSVDLDSNAWSLDFQRKISAGHVVLKSTTYPEWNTRWLIPYYHYIPIQSDYSDVYNIMAFFLGDPATGQGGHDEMAEKISLHASDFARKYWRWEDMQAYLYRLVLEYVRLGSEDREAASYKCFGSSSQGTKSLTDTCFDVALCCERRPMFPSLSLRPPTILLILVVLALITLGAWFNSSDTESTGPHHDHPVVEWQVAQAKHTMRSDGLLETNMAGRHPLWDLMEDAQRQWREMNAKQSKTLNEAVAEYIRRNGYPPPAGFDLWWDYVQKNNVKLVDEFDQINYDVTPFLALSPHNFRARVDAISDPTQSFHINITNGHVNMYGPQWWEGNERQLVSMVAGFSRAMPDLDMHGHRHMRGDSWIGADLRREAAAKARAGQFFTEDELRHYESVDRNSHRDLKNVCEGDDPIFNVTQASGAPMFVVSPYTYMSPCSSPSVHRTPPLIFTPEARPLGLLPHFVFSKHQPDSGFLLPTNTWDFHDPLLITPHAWPERNVEGAHKLFWRGPVTGWNWYKGLAESGVSWRDGARAKLALYFSKNLGPGEEVQVLMENIGPEGGLENRTYERAWLNERWMDVGLSGEPVQCNQEEGTCEEMRRAPMWGEPYPEYKESRRKFMLDLDSNAWSLDFQRRLSAGHVILKSTTYPEWNSRWLIPYYHYIPIQSDYSDVYNIMAFFLGDPETGAGEHEEMAEKISLHGSEFARKYWRWEDMQAYLHRLVLEYVRLGSEDREAASFQG
ncbi:glycosyltransferase family 90 protein [Ramaria rubella]|nr:glycosyltransferase family 90 protein [Ramaria rubella]